MDGYEPACESSSGSNGRCEQSECGDYGNWEYQNGWQDKVSHSETIIRLQQRQQDYVK